MVSIRNFALFICGTVLAGAFVAYAQDAQPSLTGLVPGRPLAVRAVPLFAEPVIRLSPEGKPIVSGATVQDLSGYREFHFNMDLPTVAKLAHMDASDAKVVHKRPALIEELEWRPPISSSSSAQADSVREILFCFYNGSLFRIVITYDQDQIEGLTDADMIEGISSMYGVATRPVARVFFFSSAESHSSDGEKVIARWQDSQYSFNLFRAPYQPTFGMVAFSKRVDPLAQAATLEAIRLDAVEAPQREIDIQKKKAEEQANARKLNKPNFRP